jgi:hypothetical protein
VSGPACKSPPGYVPSELTVFQHLVPAHFDSLILEESVDFVTISEERPSSIARARIGVNCERNSFQSSMDPNGFLRRRLFPNSLSTIPSLAPFPEFGSNFRPFSENCSTHNPTHNIRVLVRFPRIWQSPRSCKLSFRASGPRNPMKIT